MDPAGQARDDLARAEAMRASLATGLRLPSRFHTSVGIAVAVQIGTTALALTGDRSTGVALGLVLAGLLVFGAVVVVQLHRFRALNGVRVAGFASRALLGTSTLSSLAYAASLALSVWAGYAGLPWLAMLPAACGGAAYAVAAHRWWVSYQRDPAQHAVAESRAYLAALCTAAIAGLVLVAVVGR